MRRTVEVYLGDEARLVGLLRYSQDSPRESAVFEYARDWLAASDAFAIDPALPPIVGPQFRHRPAPEASIFPGAIADTEPDGWGRRVMLRDRAKRRDDARRTGAAPPVPLVTALDFLLAVDDESRLGALRFRDEHGVFCRPADQGRCTPPLVELRHLWAATRAVEMNNETAADLAYLRGRGTSLGGLRPKCSVRDDDGALAIGKFPSVNDERAVTKGEVLAMQLAALAGIDAAEARLVTSDGVPVALIRRFDRRSDGRLLYVSAATMLGAEAADPSDHSYGEIVDALRIYSPVAKADIEELWRRIAFAILITNVDDHLHNHGLLHVARGMWRLAPAFDLNPFPNRRRELKTWITAETGPRASVEALWSVAPYFQMTEDRARVVLGEIEAAVAQWRARAGALGFTPFERDQFTDAFEHEERDVARRLIG